MRTIWVGRIDGAFHGYKSSRIYHLSDGSRWQQVDGTDEPCYRENPGARLLYEKHINTIWLDVDGTSARVQVVKDGHRPRPRVGAF